MMIDALLVFGRSKRFPCFTRLYRRRKARMGWYYRRSLYVRWKMMPWITGAFSDCQEANGTRKVPNHKLTDYRRLMVYLTGGFM